MPKINLNRLIDAWDPRLQSAFLQSIANIRDQAQIEQIVKALQDGSLEAAMKAVGINPVLFRPMDKALLEMFEAGGNIVTSGFPDVGNAGEFKTIFQFDVRNPVAESWISNYSSTLITEIVEDQRNMVREYLTKGLEAGDNPRVAALNLVGRIGADGRRSGGLIGLTSSQSEWVQNYTDALASDSPEDALNYNLRDARFDAAVMRASESGVPLTADQIESMVTAYNNRALRYRAESIALTESMAALHEAQSQAIDQAIESGAISPENVELIWRITKDKRTRDSHRVMEGQTVKYGEKFVTGLGNELAYPGDPDGPAEDVIRCRCWLEPKINFYAGLE
jgi:hypothetical protein